MLMSIKNVRKKFGGVEVLKDLNMEINKGDVVVILGPSGSGEDDLPCGVLTSSNGPTRGRWNSPT